MINCCSCAWCKDIIEFICGEKEEVVSRTESPPPKTTVQKTEWVYYTAKDNFEKESD